MLGSQPQAICLAFRARRNAATLVDVPAFGTALGDRVQTKTRKFPGRRRRVCPVPSVFVPGPAVSMVH